MFKSKRKKPTHAEPKAIGTESDEEDDELRPEPSDVKRRHRSKDDKPTVAEEANHEGSEDDEPPRAAETPRRGPRKSKVNPTSFLDEILAERTKKKSRKNRG